MGEGRFIVRKKERRKARKGKERRKREEEKYIGKKPCVITLKFIRCKEEIGNGT